MNSHPAAIPTTGGALFPGRSVTVEIRPGGGESDPFSGFAGEIRRAFIVAEADTWFSVPARVSLGGRKIAGYVSSETVNGLSTATDDDPAIYVFRPYLYGANMEGR